MALLALVGSILTSAVNAHLRAARELEPRMRGRMLAESAVAAAILDLRRKAGRPLLIAERDFALEPVTCTFGPDGVAVLRVSDVGGRVDLNTGAPALFEALIAGLGYDGGLAQGIAADIEARRRAWVASATPERRRIQPALQAFITEDDVRQLPGVTPALARAMLPHLTVYSGQRSVDLRAATPALATILRTGGADSAVFAPSQRQTYVVTVAVRTAQGAVFALEAILAIVRDPRFPAGAEIKAWRDSVWAPELVPPPGASGPSCLTEGLLSAG
jgi:type II secretory pathway component PulK